MRNFHLRQFRSSSGLTLVELMVTVAIIAIIATISCIAIIATISWNLYDQQAAKNRRTDAIIALQGARVAMEQMRGDTGSYNAAALGNYLANHPGSVPGASYQDCSSGRGYTGVGGGPFTSCRGYYTITVAVPNADSYTLTATAGALQIAEDGRCRDFTLNQAGVQGVAGGLPGTVAECWSQ